MNNTLKNYLLMPMNILYKISPTAELKLLFFLKKGYKLSLSNPVTFCEKLNWIKLYDKNELFPICADKYTVRQYIEDCGYKELLNDLLWEGFDAKEIPFDELPQQFVIKVTHGSGFNIICRNKDNLNIKHTIKTLNKWLKQKYLLCYGEWFYGKVRPRIIIEKFLSEDGDTVPDDYKLYYFNNINGTPGVGFTGFHTDRFTYHKMTLYDADWKKMTGVTWGYPFEEGYQPKPKHYEEMVEITKSLAKPFPQARIDFYVVRDKLYLGEITITCSSGYARIKPYEFDAQLGSWIKLPDKNMLGVNL